MRIGTKLGLLIFLLGFGQAYAKIYNKIQVNGAESLGAKSVLYYSKLKAGHDIRKNDIKQAILALHNSGLFSDIIISEQKDILIINLKEMPIIAKISYNGTDHIPREKLIELLAQQNIAVGKVYKPSLVYGIEPMLKQSLASMGYEHAFVKVNIKQKSRSIMMDIIVNEGKELTVQDIEFVGASIMPERILLANMELPPKLWSFITNNNVFSDIALNNDLSAIEHYYKTQGYLQVKATLAKKTISGSRVYLVIKIHEGKKFIIKNIAFKGFKQLPELTISNGSSYNIEAIERARVQLEHNLASKGYAFAKVGFEAIPVPGNLVNVTYIAHPGKKVKVGRISFSGLNYTQEYVLRREMQQFERSNYNYSQIIESERRLRNLGYLKNIKCTPKTHDAWVDLACRVEEFSSAKVEASINYSGSTGINYKLELNQDNLFGSGRHLNLNLEKSDIQTSGQISMMHPYIFGTDYSNTWSIDAVKLKSANKDSASYQTNHFGFYNDFAVPVGNNSRMSFGLGFKGVKIIGYDEDVDYMADFVARHGKKFNILDFHMGVIYNNFDRLPFPNSGTSRRLTFASTLPYNDTTLRYYKIDLNNSSYIPLSHGLTLNWLLQLGFGKSYGGDKYPFFKNYWSGGENSVRGFDDNSLGPLDNKGNAKGGNIMALSTLNLYLPQNLGDDIRYGFFVDAGNVFQDTVDISEVRASYGAVAIWRTPLGLMTFSLGRPLIKKSGDKLNEFAVSMSANI